MFASRREAQFAKYQPLQLARRGLHGSELFLEPHEVKPFLLSYNAIGLCFEARGIVIPGLLGSVLERASLMVGCCSGFCGRSMILLVFVLAACSLVCVIDP
jgi:hypothetical protein